MFPNRGILMIEEAAHLGDERPKSGISDDRQKIAQQSLYLCPLHRCASDQAAPSVIVQREQGVEPWPEKSLPGVEGRF